METTTKLNVRNQMSASALIQSQGDPIRFVENPKTGKLFFTCGKYTGYVSPAVTKDYTTVKLSDLSFAECCKEGQNTWVPVLMMRSNQNVKRTLGLEEE